jgi:hypothetical protein
MQEVKCGEKEAVRSDLFKYRKQGTPIRKGSQGRSGRMDTNNTDCGRGLFHYSLQQGCENYLCNEILHLSVLGVNNVSERDWHILSTRKA